MRTQSFFCTLLAVAALITQTAAQAQAPSPLTAINILLEVDPAVAIQVQQLNVRLRESEPHGFALDATHVPHISILHRFVRTGELDKVYAAVAKAAATADPSKWQLAVTGYGITPEQHRAFVTVNLGSNPDLVRFQAKLIEAVAPYTAQPGSPAAFVRSPPGEMIDDFTINYVTDFVPKSSGDNYKPHISVGLSSAELGEKLRSEKPALSVVKPGGVAIYQLGNLGTARQRLWPR